MEILGQIAAELERGEDEKVRALTQKALDQSLDATKILGDGLIAGMNVVGESFRVHEIFLPDVLLAAKAMNAGLAVLKPHLGESDVPAVGKVVIGTVHGDLGPDRGRDDGRAVGHHGGCGFVAGSFDTQNDHWTGRVTWRMCCRAAPHGRWKWPRRLSRRGTADAAASVFPSQKPPAPTTGIPEPDRASTTAGSNIIE